ncbi:MAG: hypothetical protein M3Z22_06900 [Verrucomicrobiota bacterium]|nr:hypothetical protein [Verrucomicrobiota bacterium]
MQPIRLAPAEDQALTRARVKDYCAVLKVLQSRSDDPFAALVEKFGDKRVYTRAEVSSIESGARRMPVQSAEAETPAPKLKERPLDGWDVFFDALKHPRLRQDYSDILFTPDGNISDDVAPATFSFARDFRSEHDTWAAQAALIWPMIWRSALEAGPKPIAYGFLPSVSLNRVETGNAANDVDSLVYRAGVYSRWLLATQPNLHAALNLRGSFSYATDTRHDAGISAGEFDLEPQIFSSDRVALGYVGELLPDANDKPGDPNHLGYQLRTWLHGEFGSAPDEPGAIRAAPGDFARVGPVVQLRILAPRILQGLTLSAGYHYVPAFEGPAEHDSLFRAGVELAISKKQENRPQISLKISYTRGGLDLTRQDVETLLIGLGVLY